MPSEAAGFCPSEHAKSTRCPQPLPACLDLFAPRCCKRNSNNLKTALCSWGISPVCQPQVRRFTPVAPARHDGFVRYCSCCSSRPTNTPSGPPTPSSGNPAQPRLGFASSFSPPPPTLHRCEFLPLCLCGCIYRKRAAGRVEPVGLGLARSDAAKYIVLTVWNTPILSRHISLCVRKLLRRVPFPQHSRDSPRPLHLSAFTSHFRTSVPYSHSPPRILIFAPLLRHPSEAAAL